MYVQVALILWLLQSRQRYNVFFAKRNCKRVLQGTRTFQMRCVCSFIYPTSNKWRDCLQKQINLFLSFWDICDWSCWNIKKIMKKYAILVIITPNIFLYMWWAMYHLKEKNALHDGGFKFSKMVLSVFVNKLFK